MRINGNQLAKKWGLKTAQARYNSKGNWYHTLNRFPAALLDAKGYIIFQNDEELRSYPGVKVTEHINVRHLISTLPDYVSFNDSGRTYFIPEEIVEHHQFKEGSIDRIMVNRYERNPDARKACLKHYGYTCVVCKKSMEQTYGPEAATFVHVHHLVPLSEIGGDYCLDPIRDLRPVCPNCHAFIHLFDPPLDIEQARKKLR